MTDPQTPATEAGRRLADRMSAWDGRVSEHNADIIAIEAEARADALREAADAVRAVLTEHSSDNGQYVKWGGDALLHDMQAVLAILDPQP